VRPAFSNAHSHLPSTNRRIEPQPARPSRSNDSMPAIRNRQKQPHGRIVTVRNSLTDELGDTQRSNGCTLIDQTARFPPHVSAVWCGFTQDFAVLRNKRDNDTAHKTPPFSLISTDCVAGCKHRLFRSRTTVIEIRHIFQSVTSFLFSSVLPNWPNI